MVRFAGSGQEGRAGSVTFGRVVSTAASVRAGALQAKREDVRRLFGAGSRLHQIVTWLSGGEGADRGRALIVLDECHKAKNLLDAAGSEPGHAAVS